MIINELRAIIRIDSKQWRREFPSYLLKGSGDVNTSFTAQCECFGPSGSYISGIEGLEEITVGSAAIMGYKIDLQKAEQLSFQSANVRIGI